MPGINKAIILGRLGKDPEIKTFRDGGKIASFSVATSETWRDKQTGERKERTQWHNVAVKNEALVGIVEQYVKKGDRIYVEGAIETRKWQDQSGADRYTTEIVLGPFNSKIELLGERGGEDRGSGRSEPQQDYERRGGFGSRQRQPAGPIDDDIPF